MNNQPSPTRVRLYSHVTQSHFLHIEDALAIGKLRLFAGNYRKGQGVTTLPTFSGESSHCCSILDSLYQRLRSALPPFRLPQSSICIYA